MGHLHRPAARGVVPLVPRPVQPGRREQVAHLDLRTDVFLVQRLRSSFDLLGCANLLHQRNPVPVVKAAALDAADNPAAVAPPPAPEPTPSQQHN